MCTWKGRREKGSMRVRRTWQKGENKNVVEAEERGAGLARFDSGGKKNLTCCACKI